MRKQVPQSEKEKNEMSNRQRNSKRNKHVIHYWWRGDIEDEQYWRFPTQEAAWAHVVGEIRKRAKRFEYQTTEHGYPPTQIDWDKLKNMLFGSDDYGYAEVMYCQCSTWWDNWEYFKKTN